MKHLKKKKKHEFVLKKRMYQIVLHNKIPMHLLGEEVSDELDLRSIGLV